MKEDTGRLSIIDAGVTVDGTISGKGQLVIKGVVKGSIDGGKIVIAEHGAVLAETKAASITIGGKFEGRLEVVEDLIILSSGSCKGEVVCKDLVVEEGGILNAKVTSGTMTHRNPS